MKERLQLMLGKWREALGKLTGKFTKKTLIIFGAAIVALVCIISANSGKKESKGLEYVLVNDFLSSGSYEVVGIGTCNDKDIVIPEEYKGKPVTSIAEEAFKECDKIKSVTIPGSVVDIGDSAFEYCRSLKAVALPKSIKKIGNKVFYGCFDLTSITIPNSVTDIGEDAFSCCFDLKRITIPDSVTSIGERAFSGCSSLTSISVEPENANYKSIDGNLYTKDGKRLLQYAVGKTNTSFVIPHGVTSIDHSAFSLCSNLTSITIPNSVTSIGSLSNCSGLRSISVDSGNMHYKSIDGNLYTKDGKMLIQYAIGKTNTSFVIPHGVTSIDHSAFSDCSSLTSITIPGSVTSIDFSAFALCTSLTSINFEGNVAKWHAVDKEVNWNFNVPATYVQCSDGTVPLT